MGIIESIKRVFRDELMDRLAKRYGLEAKAGANFREGFLGTLPLSVETYQDSMYLTLGEAPDEEDSYYLERVGSDYDFEDDEKLDKYVGSAGRDAAKQYALAGIEDHDYRELGSKAFLAGLPRLSDAVIGVDVYQKGLVLCLNRTNAKIEDIEADLELARDMVKALAGQI